MIKNCRRDKKEMFKPVKHSDQEVIPEIRFGDITIHNVILPKLEVIRYFPMYYLPPNCSRSFLLQDSENMYACLEQLAISWNENKPHLIKRISVLGVHFVLTQNDINILDTAAASQVAERIIQRGTELRLTTNQNHSLPQVMINKDERVKDEEGYFWWYNVPLPDTEPRDTKQSQLASLQSALEDYTYQTKLTNVANHPQTISIFTKHTVGQEKSIKYSPQYTQELVAYINNH